MEREKETLQHPIAFACPKWSKLSLSVSEVIYHAEVVLMCGKTLLS